MAATTSSRSRDGSPVGARKAKLRASGTVARSRMLMELPLIPRRKASSLRLHDLGVPRTLDATLDRLISRALLGVARQHPVDFVPRLGLSLEAVTEANLGDLQNSGHVFDVALDMGHEVVRRRNSPHVQCGPEGAGQSASDPGNDVVERGRVFRASELSPVLLLVELFDASVNAEVDRLRKVLDMGRAVRSRLLLDTQSTGMNDAHGWSSSLSSKEHGGCPRRPGSLFFVR